MAGVRSFIAIELAEDLLDALARIQTRLQTSDWADEVRWVRPAGIHLTLKFLGDVPPDRIDAIGQGVAQATAGVAPFTITVEGLGVFPNWRRPGVIWLGVGGAMEQLHAVQQRIEQAMAELGFEPEGRPFHPHLTLARADRRISPGVQRRLGEELKAEAVGLVGRMRVAEVSLMRSQLRPQGAVYSQLGVYALS